MLMWIVYVILVSALLGVAALAAEKRARMQRRTSLLVLDYCDGCFINNSHHDYISFYRTAC